jgi:hypothetical protein
MGGPADVPHRQLAVDLFNATWRLLAIDEPSAEQVDELIHTAHASRYHWGIAGTRANEARGEWQCSRVYAELGRPEPALWHARRCLALVEAGGEGFEDWDLAAAHEGMARALACAGDDEEATHHVQSALELLELVADVNDRAVIEMQLDELRLRTGNGPHGRAR